MAKVGGNSLNLQAGFNIKGQEPIDSRLVVSTVSDLINSDTWNGVGVYNGMIVATETGELRILINRDDITNEKSWVSIKGGGGGSTDNGYIEDL